MNGDGMDVPASRQRLLLELFSQGVRDGRVLEAIAETPRDLFVPPELAGHAWENIPLPIGCSQTISQPVVVALMTERLDLRSDMCVLEIGTGSGYQTAVLSLLARRVWSLERHETLLREASSRFVELGLENIETRLGDGSFGWPERAPFDRIIVTAAATRMPERLIGQLTPGGIMVAPVGETIRDQKLYCVRRLDDGYQSDAFLDVRFVPLVEDSA